ncbi:Rho GTPase activating protein with PAK-box/P21-Rho-binding domain-containing protein [Perilla frutescens var. hirtella]|nr:Rho GTPase activating protein with PAK-box/P21-Rho-binding domain-containing protein [Perilla frutescens var. hirtella]
MEIGWPTDVQHVNHVTFDRFDGFLGLPVEFEPEVPRRAPSASATVFGVSTESMQLSYDLRGNSIPTILLLLQRHLYSQGGLQAEGVFRITAGNSQEEYVRDQLNRGVVPQGVDVHCLAGLIKAWFRELPRGVLDSLSPEQVMQCQSEEACDALVRLLPPTEAALLDWAINLMADVVQEEHLNKMNARNIAMVFAPNMTQMADPLTALMYAVQVMNFLKTLIEKTLRERGDSVVEQASMPNLEPSDDNGHETYAQVPLENSAESYEETTQAFVMEDPGSESDHGANQVDNMTDEDYFSKSTSTEESDGSQSSGTPAQESKAACPREARAMNGLLNQLEEKKTSKTSQSNNSHQTKPESRIDIQQQAVDAAAKIDNLSKGVSNLSRINSITERNQEKRTMAACGGLEHIFEKPLSETPTFLESLSPWKHIKSVKPIDDDSSFTEIFGELHFKERHVHPSPPSPSSSSSSSSNPTSEADDAKEVSTVDQEREGYYPCSQRKPYRNNNDSFSSESLSLCTEGLGFESFDDVEEMLAHDLCSKEWLQNQEQDGEKNDLARNSHSEKPETPSRTSRGAFPPPISCIGRSGKPWVCFKSYREDGRFILREIRIPTQEFLHACRQDGRLKLHFVQSDDEVFEEEEEVEDEDENENDDHVQEHEMHRNQIAGENQERTACRKA